jgi:hypothetical protein
MSSDKTKDDGEAAFWAAIDAEKVRQDKSLENIRSLAEAVWVECPSGQYEISVFDDLTISLYDTENEDTALLTISLESALVPIQDEEQSKLMVSSLRALADRIESPHEPRTND